MNRRDFLQLAGATQLPRRVAGVSRRGTAASSPRRRSSPRCRPASPPVTSAAGAPSSGAAPIAPRGCSSSSRRPSASRIRGACAVRRRSRRPTSRRGSTLTDLPAGQRIFYRVLYQDLSDLRTWSEPVAGSFTTPSTDAARRHDRLVRRHRRPGLGHQSGLGRAAPLRNDAARAAGRVHQRRRHDLRRSARRCRK